MDTTKIREEVESRWQVYRWSYHKEVALEMAIEQVAEMTGMTEDEVWEASL